MMNTINKISFFVISAILATSCQTEVDDVDTVSQIVESKSVERAYAKLLYTKKTEGSILLQSNASIMTQENNKNVGFSQALSRDKKNSSTIKINFKNLELHNTNKSSGLNESLSGAFGTTLTYSINDSNKPSRSSQTNSVYIPELLNVTYSTDVLEEGTVISWNVDLQNDNGVVVYANYNPASQPDVRIAYENPQRVKETIFLTEVQGIYVVKASDLERFPKNAVISVDVLRAGFSIEKDEPVVAGITKVNTDLEVIR